MTKRETVLASTLIILTGVAFGIPRFADARPVDRPAMRRALPEVCSPRAQALPLGRVPAGRAGLVSSGLVEPPFRTPCIAPASGGGMVDQAPR